MTDSQFDSLSKGCQARLDILQAAKRLFLGQGYNGTSMRAIAREAGDRAVAGLYNHFDSKEAIFRALIEELNPYDELLTALESSLEGVDYAPDFVQAALRTVLRIMPRHFDFVQLVQIDLREFGGETIGHVLRQQAFPRIFAVMQRLELLPGLKPMERIVRMRLMFSLVIGYILTDRLVAATDIFGEFNAEDWADHFADALLYGIAEQ